MTRTRKMLTLGLSAVITAALAIPALPVSAVEEKYYTYNEIAAMSDEEFIEVFGDSYADEIAAGFGDDSISDEEKFEIAYPNSSGFGSIGSYCKMFADGSRKAFMRFAVAEGEPFDFTLTAADFGLPADWVIECFDGYIELGDNDMPLHQYHVYVPSEIYGDFESFVKLYEAEAQLESYYYNNEDEYPIISFRNPFEEFLSMGEMVQTPITTTTTTSTATTTVTTTTTTVTSISAETTSTEETSAEAATTVTEASKTESPTAAPTNVTSTTVTTKAPAKTTAAKKNNSPKTGDSGITGIVLAGVGAVAVAFALRKREE